MKTIDKNTYFGYRSFLPEFETMKRFRALGVDTFTLMISNGYALNGKPYTKYQPVWLGDRNYDFDILDKMFQDFIATVDDGKIILYIDLNSPPWIIRRYGFNTQSDLGKYCSSASWREMTATYFQDLLTHIESRYSDRVMAYIYTGGGSTEWFDHSLGEESRYRWYAYRNWLRQKGRPDPVALPTRPVREKASREFRYVEEIRARFNRTTSSARYPDPANIPDIVSGLFRTPEEDREALDFYRFISSESADTIIYFAKKAREVIRPEAELGTVYGYLTDFSRGVSNGQLEYERVFAAPELDFIVAETVYDGREIGGGGGSRTMPKTAHRFGKRTLNACDHRTYTMRLPEQYNPNMNVWKNAAEVEAGMKRELSMTLITHSSMWWFDMLGGWWSSPEAEKVIEQGKKIWDEESRLQPPEIAETMVVFDPANMYFLNDMHGRHDFRKFTSAFYRAAHRSGIPALYASFNDLESMDLSRIRLIILQHPFSLDGETGRILREKLCRDGRTIVFFYGPGIIDNGKWNPENVKNICGVPFGAPGINTAEMDGWRSVYIGEPDDLTTASLRTIAEEAGVHLWCDLPRPVHANARLAALHTGEAGTLKFKLPGKYQLITELFSGKTYENTDEIILSPQGPETWLFRYE